MPIISTQEGYGGIRLLSLDDGGIPHGYSQLIILETLMEMYRDALSLEYTPRPADIFHLIAGAGVGGINSALLGRLRLSVAQAKEEYITIVTKVFSLQPKTPSFYRRILKKETTPQATFNAVLFEECIQEILKRHLGKKCKDAEMMQQSELLPTGNSIITATLALNPIEPRLFHSYKPKKYRKSNVKIWEAIRATTASTSLFDRAWIGTPDIQEEFIGSVGHSNPTFEVLKEAKTLYGDLQRISALVSLGSGKGPIASLRSGQDSSTQHVIDFLTSVANDCERISRLVSVQLRTIDSYFRFEVDQGMQMILPREWSRLAEVMTHTQVYLEDPDTTSKLKLAVKGLRGRTGPQRVTMTPMAETDANTLETFTSYLTMSTYFVERPQLSSNLSDLIFKEVETRSSTPRPIVVQGPGGVGKTELVKSVLNKNRKRFWKVFILDASSESTLKHDIQTAGRSLGSIYQNVSYQEALDAFKRQKMSIVLVYDNADDPTLSLEPYFPRSNNIPIIVTTRNPQFRSPFPIIRVGEMELSEATALLISTAQLPPAFEGDESITEIVTRLGRSALAIVQAGSVIATSGRPDEYLAEFDTAAQDISPVGDLAEADQKAALLSWEASFATLDKVMQMFLSLCSFFHHSLIPEQMITLAARSFEAMSPKFQPLHPHDFRSSLKRLRHIFGQDEAKVTDRLQRITTTLESRSLMQILVDEDGRVFYNIHPLVHHRAKSRLQDGFNLYFYAAVRLAVASIRAGIANPRFLLSMPPHVEALLSVGLEIDPADRWDFRKVFSSVGDAEKSLTLGKEILTDLRKAGSDNSVLCKVSFGNIKELGKQGKFKEALHGLEKLISFSHSDSSDHLMFREYRLHLYQSMGKEEEAQKIGQQLLPLFERRFGRQSKETITVKIDIARSFLAAGKPEEVIRLLEGLSKKAEDTGPVPKQIELDQVLARAYSSLNRHSDAISLGKKCLDSQMNTWGPDHIDTATVNDCMGSIYLKRGDYNLALPYFAASYQTKQRQLGPLHSSTLSVLSKMANCHLQCGRREKAIELLQQCVDNGQEAHENGHPGIQEYRQRLEVWKAM